MRSFSKKQKVAAAFAAATIAGSGTAYAYWTTTGGGNGSAATVSAADAQLSAIQIAQTSTQASDLTGFFPAEATASGAVKDITVTVSNPAGFAQNVGDITVAIAAAQNCGIDNWDLVQKSVAQEAVGVLTPSGTTGASKAAVVGTLRLKETGTNQDGCKGVSPVLTFTSAPGAGASAPTTGS